MDFNQFSIVPEEPKEVRERKVRIVEYEISYSDNSEENKDSIVKVINNLTYKEEARVIISDIRGNASKKIIKYIKKFKQEYKNSQVANAKSKQDETKD